MGIIFLYPIRLLGRGKGRNREPTYYSPLLPFGVWLVFFFALLVVRELFIILYFRLNSLTTLPVIGLSTFVHLCPPFPTCPSLSPPFATSPPPFSTFLHPSPPFATFSHLPPLLSTFLHLSPPLATFVRLSPPFSTFPYLLRLSLPSSILDCPHCPTLVF